MWPKVVVVSTLTLQLLVVQPTAANPIPEAIPLPDEGGVFHLLQSVTVDSGENGDDQVRGISVADDGTVYVAGYVSVAGQGRNIWLAKYDEKLAYQDSITVNGLANGDDEGYTMAFDGSGNLFLVGYMTQTGEGHDIWIGRYDVSTFFTDGFESGDTTSWSATAP